MPQFTINKEPVGDVVVNTGYVVDLTTTTTESFFVGSNINGGTSQDPDTNSYVFSQRFAGGSGRNMLIENVISPDIPSGWMKQFKNQLWNSEDGPFKCAVNPDNASLEFSDETDVIFTVPAGSIPIYGRIECSLLAQSGGVGSSEFIVDLGTSTGNVDLTFDAFSIPDIFKVEYDGVEVINTGYRGVSGTYDGVPVTVAGPGSGVASFTKSTSSPTWAKVIVEAPFSDTAWTLTLGCPGGSPPPYTSPPIGTRISLTGTSTAYGTSLNSGTPFTVQIAYENGPRSTSLNLTSDIVMFSNEFVELSSQLWRDQFVKYNVSISDLGIATFYDHQDVIAIREESKLIDPSGIYVSTAYGKTLIGVTEDFSIAIQMNYKSPLNLHTFIALDVSSGSITSVRGPFSDTAIPMNTSTEKYIPISYSNGSGIVSQIHEGTLFWK